MTWEKIRQLNGPAVSAELNTHCLPAPCTPRYDYTIDWNACMPLAMAYHIDIAHRGTWHGATYRRHIIVGWPDALDVIVHTEADARIAVCHLALWEATRKRERGQL